MLTKHEANQYVMSVEDPDPDFFRPTADTIALLSAIPYKVGKCFDWKEQRGQEVELLRMRGFKYAYNLGYPPATQALYTNVELVTDMEDLTTKDWFDLELTV